jgi:hypothetical protein
MLRGPRAGWGPEGNGNGEWAQLPEPEPEPDFPDSGLGLGSYRLPILSRTTFTVSMRMEMSNQSEKRRM